MRPIAALSFHLPLALQRELDGLNREPEPELRAEGLMNWARRAEAAGHGEVAAATYEGLLGDSDLSEGLRRRAGQRREILDGGGSWSARLEHQAGHLTQELLSPASILAMGAGGAVFRLTRWTMLGRLALSPAGFWTRGRTASALASFAGFLLEAPAFTLSSQAFRSLGGEPLPNRGALGRELLRSYLSLGGLRLGGALARGAQRGLGLESNPLAAPLFHQAGMFGGILAGGIAEERSGLLGPRTAADRLFDSLVLLLHFNLGGRIAQQAFGPQFQAWEQAVDRQSLTLSRLPRTERPRRPAWSSPLLAPMWMMMGAGGFGRPRGPQLSLDFSAPSRPAANSAPPLPPDLAMAESLRHASPEAWSRGLESLQSRGLLVSESHQVSFIRHLRLKPGIARLGEIFRNQGPAANEAAAALRELAAEDRPAVLREFQRALRESHTLGAVQALNALAALNATELLPEIQALPQNHPSPIAAAAEAARLRLHDDSLIPNLLRRAQDRRQSDTDRIAAWEALGRRHDRNSAIESLRGFFRRFHSAATQRRAALALTRIGASAAVLSLEHHIEHSARSERAEFAEAFFEQGSIRQALRIWDGLVRSQAVEGRTLALRLSAAHSMPAMIDGLRALLSDPYPEVRLGAGQRLVELGQARHAATVESLLEWSNPSSLRESETLQVRAAAALLAHDEHPAARERLMTYLGSSFGPIRLEAAAALLARGESAAAVRTLRQLSQDGNAELRYRAAGLLGARGMENTPAGSRLGASIGLFGLGALAWLLDPALAEASVGAGHAEASGWLLPTLLAGAAVMATARGSRGSEPPAPGSNPPPEILGRFENPWNAAEAYPLPLIGENGAIIGRSTLAVPNVFDADLRHIARRHMDLRVQQGRIEVRLHDGARGLRINGQNLLPFEWYPLRDQDLVEFVGAANADIPAFAREPDGSLVQGVLRLGQKPVEAVDYPAIFRFRLNPPAPPPAPTTPLPPRPPQNFLERLGGWLAGSRPAEEPQPAAAPSTPPPASAALRSDLYAEIRRLSQTLATPMGLLEMSLRSPSFQSAESRTDVLTSLIRIHRQICGRAETWAWADAWVRVPAWDGILAGRLENFGQELRRIEQERGASPELQNAQLELGRIRDQLNRLFEMVRLFRRHFQEPAELVRFDAIEQAYQGLRPEVVAVGQRVRSATRGLDATVRPSDRQLWTAEFESWDRPSRSMVNLRILLGEIREVRGRPVAGSFYTALSSGTIYEGRRSVRFHYDTSSGQILGFDDGSPAAEAAIQRFLQDRLNVEEGILVVDPSGSGRITDVTLIGSPREAVVEALRGLIDLRVLPPQVVRGWSGHAGDPDLRSYQLHLVPEFESPREDWYRVAGLIRDFEGDQSLLTMEPVSPDSSRPGIQILVPRIDSFGISVDDVLTVR